MTFRRQSNQSTTSRAAIATTPQPAPIPAFAAVLNPDEEESTEVLLLAVPDVAADVAADVDVSVEIDVAVPLDIVVELELDELDDGSVCTPG